MGVFEFFKPKDKVLETKIKKLDEKLQKKKEKLKLVQEEINKANEELAISATIKEKTELLNDLESKITELNEDIHLQEYGFFEKKYKFSDSVQYKEALNELRKSEKELVKKGLAGIILEPMLLNNSKAQGRAMQKQLAKSIIRAFNGECDSYLVKITPSNLEAKQRSLDRSFNQLNKMYSRNNVAISSEYYSLKNQELELASEYELVKQEEKEILREQREAEREEKKLQNEIKEKRKQIKKDRKHYQKMIEKINSLLNNSEDDDDNEEYLQQLNLYQEKLAELDEIEEEIDYREVHATAGYVYVISNIGAFGEGVYKIGVTRRLDPTERIRELGNASVPFKFDTHAMVFSEEAFELEKKLHKRFDSYRVNKVNNRKEYFKVPFEEIKKALLENKDLTIEINEYPEAFEYRQGLTNTTSSQ